MNNHKPSLLALSLAALAAACATSNESAQRDTMTESVGSYSAPPPSLQAVRIGVPTFEVKDRSLERDLADLAADQATTLFARCERFEVIERAQIKKLLDEQGLEGIVTAGEMARPAQVRGVDYLLLGKITNLRIKSERAEKGFGVGSLPIALPGGMGRSGVLDYSDKSTTIRVDCGVDLRLVDPTTGSTAVADFGEFTRTDTVGALGIAVLGSRSNSEADLQLDSDSKGKILRLALDDCLRKMLPRVDKVLLARGEQVSKSGTGSNGGK
jgi:curli biogenesis system outer membrane secretion channel CsgG